MFTAYDVSVVIPSYNSRNTILACLDSLENQEEKPLEIIVVDTSGDGTAELIASCYPEVRLRVVKRRLFPGPARNLGAKLAHGAIIAFTDADCIVEPGWVRKMAEGHNAGHHIVGGSVGVGNPFSQTAWAGHLGEFREFLPLGEPRCMLHAPTCNISYRKSLFMGKGGFPNAYYPQEDLLFNYLLNRQGWCVWFNPDIHVRHFCREELRAYLSHQHRIGRVTRSTLRRIEMPGSAVSRRGWLAWLAAPILGLVKFLRTAFVFTLHFPREAFRRPGLLLLLALGALWWARGFAAGARRGLSGIYGWDDPEEPIFAMLTSMKASKQK